MNESQFGKWVVITKGVCLTYVPIGTTLASGLGKLGVNSLVGLPVSFWELVLAASVAGAGGLLAFLSSSFHTFSEKMKNGSGDTRFLVNPALAGKVSQP